MGEFKLMKKLNIAIHWSYQTTQISYLLFQNSNYNYTVINYLLFHGISNPVTSKLGLIGTNWYIKPHQHQLVFSSTSNTNSNINMQSRPLLLRLTRPEHWTFNSPNTMIVGILYISISLSSSTVTLYVV